MFSASLRRQQRGSASEALTRDADRGEQPVGKGSPVGPCGRGDGEAVTPAPRASAEAYELPELNTGSTEQGCLEAACERSSASGCHAATF